MLFRYFYLIILLLAYPISNLSLHSLTLSNILQFPPKIFQNVLITLNDQLIKLCSEKFKSFYLTQTNCSIAIQSSINELHIDNLFLYSTNLNNLLGSESSCILNNFSYHLITYDIISPSYNPSSSIDLFLGLTRFHFALCLWKECDKTVLSFFDHEINSDFFNALLEHYHIVFMELLDYDSIRDDNLSLGFVIVWSCILVVLVIRIGMMLIGMGIKLNEQAKLSKENHSESFNDDDMEDQNGDDLKKYNNSDHFEDDDNESEGNNVGKKTIDNIHNQQDSILKEEIAETTLFANANSKEDQSEIRHLESYLHKDLNNNNINININNNLKQSTTFKSIIFKCNLYSFITDILNFCKKISFNNVFSLRSNLYNNNSLESISGIRVILLFLYVFNLTFRLFYKVSPMHIDYSEIYVTKAFYIIKLSSYSIYCLIYLDGFIFIFKLMHYIKGKETFKHFLLFYLKNIPRIFIFLIIFFLFYIYINNYAIILGKTSLFESYYISHFKNICFETPYSLLNPYFFFQLHPNNHDCEYCYRFCYLIIQEFYCITIVSGMLYLLQRIRVPILDLCLFIISIGSIALSYVFYFKLFTTKQIDKDMIGYDVISPFKFVIGESLTLMQTVLIFNLFFLGVINGLIYYYYVISLKDVELFFNRSLSVSGSFANINALINDSNNNNAIIDDNSYENTHIRHNKPIDINSTATIKYVPFDFLLIIIKAIHNQSQILRVIIMSFSIILIVFLSMNYTFMKFIYLKKSYEMIIPMNALVRIVYVYETPLAVILFSLFFLVFMLSDSKINVKLLFNHKIFDAVERVSFEIYCISEWMIILFYSLFNLEGLKWNLATLINISCFMFVFILLKALLLCFVFHVPIKYFTKKILRDDHSVHGDVYD